MSLIGMKNLIQPRKWNYLCRSVTMRREDSAFFSDAGELEWEDADEISGFHMFWTHRENWQAYLDGDFSHLVRLETAHYDDISGYNDWLEREHELAWDALSPMEDVRRAFDEHEYMELAMYWDQYAAMERAANEGIEEAPLFLTRVKESPLRGTW